MKEIIKIRVEISELQILKQYKKIVGFPKKIFKKLTSP
jgi:hypothetical protein